MSTMIKGRGEEENYRKFHKELSQMTIINNNSPDNISHKNC